MAELDLSLSDALTDSVPQPGPESHVERDFVAQLEAEAFDDQIGETVGKTDYIPLLDNDDTRAGESDMEFKLFMSCNLSAVKSKGNRESIGDKETVNVPLPVLSLFFLELRIGWQTRIHKHSPIKHCAVHLELAVYKTTVSIEHYKIRFVTLSTKVSLTG